MSSHLARQITGVLESRLSFEEFARNTRGDFERMATALLRRWTPPAWLTLEDLVQELLFGAWSYMWKWERDRGVEVERFVVYNATSHAKRALHRARGASLSGSADRNPSHIEQPFSSVGSEEDGEHMVERLLAEDALDIEAAIDAKRMAEVAIGDAFRACRSLDEQRALVAMIRADGDPDKGGLLYWMSGGSEWLPTEEHSKVYVRQLTDDLARRIA